MKTFLCIYVMASNQIPSTDSTECNNNNSVQSKEHPKLVKKTVVAYRPSSKAKKSSSRLQYVANKMNKSPEDLQDEVIQLKKVVSLASISDENSTLKAKIRRTEEENVKKDKQILQYLDPNQNEELRRLLMDKKSAANTTINNLKQRVIKLELSLKEKEQALKKLQTDLKATKVKETKVQLETCYAEIARLKSLNQKKTSPGKAQKEYMEDAESEDKMQSRFENYGPSAVERAYSGKVEYANMTRDQLLSVLVEMEKKLKRQRPDGTSDSKLYHEKKKLEEKLKQVSEELHSYQKLSETRETEIKSLRSTLANLQRSSEKDIGLRQSTSSRIQQNSSEAEKLGSVARETSAPTRSNKQFNPLPVQDSFTMSSTVRKMSSKGTEVRKTGSGLVSPRAKAEDKSDSPNLAGKRSLNKLELDLSKISYDSRRVLSARSSVRSSKLSSSTLSSVHSMQHSESEQWVMQATVRKLPEKSMKLNRTSPTGSKAYPQNKNQASNPVLKSPNKLLINGAESKFQAAGDSQRVVDFHVVEEFRQNRAAKKIQKGWKKHQKDINQIRQEKLQLIRINCAARTIQHGWKKHQGQEIALSDTDHDDDDDVVC
uniref:Uncharacterized protein n=1 Tax=Strigamia maritima TaxID=126957 RepID=T1JGV1_STRMM